MALFRRSLHGLIGVRTTDGLAALRLPLGCRHVCKPGWGNIDADQPR